MERKTSGRTGEGVIRFWGSPVLSAALPSLDEKEIKTREGEPELPAQQQLKLGKATKRARRPSGGRPVGNESREGASKVDTLKRAMRAA